MNKYTPHDAYLIEIDDKGHRQRLVYTSDRVSLMVDDSKEVYQQVSEESVKHYFDALVKLNQGLPTFGELIYLRVGTKVYPVHLSMFIADTKLLMIGFYHTHDIKSYTDLVGLNSDLLNQYRVAMQQSVSFSTQTDQELFEELSSLNNELMTMQRELQRKKVELEVLNKELETISMHDGLTGLGNRRKLQSQFGLLQKRAQRYKMSLALVLVDLNHFKKVNDTLGHDQGDDLLIYLGRCILSTIRQGVDDAFRIGGDEFVIMLYDVKALEVEVVMQRIGDLFMEKSTIASLSYGISLLSSDQMVSLDQTLKLSDARMYDHKRATKKEEAKIKEEQKQKASD